MFEQKIANNLRLKHVCLNQSVLKGILQQPEQFLSNKSSLQRRLSSEELIFSEDVCSIFISTNVELKSNHASVLTDCILANPR